jgi:hypothetical protein
MYGKTPGFSLADPRMCLLGWRDGGNCSNHTGYDHAPLEPAGIHWLVEPLPTKTVHAPPHWPCLKLFRLAPLLSSKLFATSCTRPKPGKDAAKSVVSQPMPHAFINAGHRRRCGDFTCPRGGPGYAVEDAEGKALATRFSFCAGPLEPSPTAEVQRKL